MNMVEVIASLCHEVNRTWCAATGDDSQPAWADAPGWQKDSARKGVEAHLQGSVSPEQSHQLWMKEKERTGWVYGAVKDAEKKTHPCMVPYQSLPVRDRIKDQLFGAIVGVFKKTGREPMPKTRDELIEECVQSEAYFLEGTTTICVLATLSGFRIVGTSSSGPDTQFDAELGRRIACDDALDKLWAHEVYRRMSA